MVLPVPTAPAGRGVVDWLKGIVARLPILGRFLPNGTRLESNTMNHTSILGSSAARFAAQLLGAAALSVLLISPVAAQPLAQAGGLESSAPDNLRCPGL